MQGTVYFYPSRQLVNCWRSSWGRSKLSPVPCIPLSLRRREPRHQRVAVAGIGEPDMGHRLVGAPGAALDDQAGASARRCRAPRRFRRRPRPRGCVCSAALHGTRPSSHGPGAISAKLSSAASGTAARLISRSSRQNGLLAGEMAADELDHAACRRRRRSAAGRPPCAADVAATISS